MDKKKKPRQQTLMSFFGANAAGKLPNASQTSNKSEDASSPAAPAPPSSPQSDSSNRKRKHSPQPDAVNEAKDNPDEVEMPVSDNDSPEEPPKKKAARKNNIPSGRLIKKGDAAKKAAAKIVTPDESASEAEDKKVVSPRKRKARNEEKEGSPPPSKKPNKTNSDNSDTEVDDSPAAENPISPEPKQQPSKKKTTPTKAINAKATGKAKTSETKIEKNASSSFVDTPQGGTSSPTSEFEKDEKEAVKEEKEQDDDKKFDKEVAKATVKMMMAGGGSPKKGSQITWKKGDDVPYAALTNTFEAIESTTKRLQITADLTDFFKRVLQLSPHNLVACIYLCLNRVGPEYEGKELGIGESILIKAIAEATARSAASIKSELAEKGDLGDIAQSSKGKQKSLFKPAALTVPSVFKTLKEISAIMGTSSQQKKIALIKKMLSACQGNEPKFLIRSLEGKLRIGVAERTVLPALANATVAMNPDFAKWSTAKREQELEEAASVIKQVYSELPTYDEIVPALLEKGTKGLAEACKLRPGVPLKPMLAHPTKAISEVLDRFEDMSFTCEYKYDGERAQIHMLEDGTVMIYSRNSENLSAKYPDVIERLHKIPKEGVKSFVLDGECVAWDREKKCILPFQVLSTRKRKDVQTADIQVQVCIFGFDLIYLNGEALTKEPLIKRRELLHTSFKEVEGEFAFAKYMDGNTVEEIQTFLDEAVAGNCEGLMVKTLEKEASYEPSKRSRNWLKVKKDYLSGAGDSLDLVVMGGYLGKGKRTGWYGGYLLACWDDDREEYQSICKIGTGFSEEQLAEHAKFFKAHIIDRPRPYYRYTDTPNLRPDVWFEPVQVWEVKAADLSISPVHQAAIGLVDSSKGISLRFPRFIRVRDDKSPEQATSATQVAEFYRNQKINSAKGGKDEDDD
ncbi:tRNA ligase [Rhizophlyctis rosea]|uniref:DNA ligase n=1 Tax=Rhizophlyctis rosea TaxID=64517 RepID=A0AAD5X4R5_9FUNG|nr:tRNA ligase [Rhizophlyctis rosea]